jgi:hypothetical protein
MEERLEDAVAAPVADAAPAAPVPLVGAPGFDGGLMGASAAPPPRLTGVNPQVARAMIGRFGPLVGNAAIARALAPPDAGREVRSRVEAVTGYDLGDAVVHESSARAAAAGVDGLAVGRDVHLAPGVSPETGHGAHVLAHELAHVVQQGTGSPGGGRAPEADAEAVATRARSAAAGGGTALASLPPPRELVVQLFDPRYHRTSVVDGLEGSGFTPDEIGAIYAANWERDLSQAHPSLANVILAWKSAKVAAYEGHLTEAHVAAFQSSCQAVLEQVTTIALTTGSVDAFLDATSYGGYQFYEHMDNPEGGKPGSKQDVQARKIKAVLGGKNTSGLPDHIYISREYIKEMLFNAVKLVHPDLAGTPTAAVAASSAETRKKLGEGPGTPDKPDKPGAAPAPEGTHGGSTAPVAAETSHEVQAKTPGATGGGLSQNPEAYALIGRASHALEDFWSHSNFVERAIGDPDFKLEGLNTATFGDDDKKHALAHKIRGVADEVEAELPLIDRMAMRRDTDPRKDEVHVGDETPVVHEDDEKDKIDAITDAGKVLGGLGKNIYGGFVRGYERAAAKDPKAGFFDKLLGGAAGAVVGGTASIVGSKAGVYALRQVAEKIDEDTEKKQLSKGDYRAHGLLAKDQPGHEDTTSQKLKTAKFELAHALSVEADKRTTGKMKAVLDAADAAEADARLQEIFTDLDALIADAKPGHPLWGIVEAHRAEAEAALNAYLASKPGAGDLAPSTPPTAVPV